MSSTKKIIPPFGKEIKKRLIELNMTQRELAVKINVNENYLTDIVNGRRSGKKYKNAIMEALYNDTKPILNERRIS